MRLLPLIFCLLAGCSCASISKLNSPAIVLGDTSAKKVAVAKEQKPDLSRAIPIGRIDQRAERETLAMIDGLINAGATQITIVINSTGGEIPVAFRIVDKIESLQKRGAKFRCIGDRNVKSAALSILLACNERLATKRTTFMEHEISYQNISGNAEMLRRAADELDTDNKAFVELLGARLKIGPKGVAARIIGKQWDFAWEEALAVGAIDGIIDPKDIPFLYEMPKPDLSDLLKMLEP